MMQRFDVLSRDEKCFSSRFLEASAGTGKTFAIENLFSRFLIENDTFQIEEILVITFTKAATKDLQKRILSHLQRLVKCLMEECDGAPDYLLAIKERGVEETRLALSRLQQAIALFDDAQIFTIHSFCLRMLKEHALFLIDLSEDEMIEERKKTRSIVLDVLRNKLHSCSVGQLERLFKSYEEESLISKIETLMSKGTKVAPCPSFKELFEAFKLTMNEISGEGILDAFLEEAPSYEGVCNRQGEIKADIVEEASAFAELFSREITEEDFDRLISKGLVIADSLETLKKRAQKKELTKGLQDIVCKLKPIVDKARDINVILARLVGLCLELKRGLIEKDEYFDPDEILRRMQKHVQEDAFVAQIQERYKAAIIDEFQDTDPIQWQIFKRCFTEKICYLVGDPKQSIYSFRQADIYTYLEAAQVMGEDKRACLDTNYRSTPKLVEALNALFAKGAPMLLPKLAQTLIIEPVKSAPGKQNKEFADNRGSIHFFVASDETKRGSLWPTISLEEEFLFPFIANEICSLNIPLNEMAILVRDRFQELRLQEFLKKRGIPFASKRSQVLAETKAFAFLHKLFTALTVWHDKNMRLEIEATPLFVDIDVDLLLTEITKGLAVFFEKLLRTLAPDVLSKEEGINFYRDLMELYEKLLEAEPTWCLGIAKEALAFLNKLKQEDVKISPYVDESAVNILTLHVSKGLEFGIVFALGVASRTFQEEELILENDVLYPADKKSNTYLSYIQERDAEKARQLYVGLTRAKWRLYVPYIIDLSEKEREVGTSSPIELFIKDLNVPHVTVENIQKREPLHYSSKAYVPVLAPPQEVAITKESAWINSFTALSRTRENQFVVAPKEGELPLGAQTGILLHEMIEKHFTKSSKVALSGTVLEGFSEKAEEVVQKVLNVPLDGFCLKDVERSTIFTEVEFLMPQDEASYLTGFIDLVAYHKGKYYIFDWKSNWLPDYEQETMKTAMETHDYTLQAKIYTLALRKHLSCTEKRPFEEVFGGVYYIFLRGLDGTQRGVYKAW